MVWQKVKREALMACLTCPICNKLLKDATTISLCLHTFCRKCIYKRFSDDEEDCCPVCNIDLGVMPVEKLRQDHNLQDIRAKIFPFKRTKDEALEPSPLVALHTKRKERSLSSLVINAPKVSLQTGSTGKRSKSGSRKAAALRGCRSNSTEDSGEDKPMSSSSPESPHKTMPNKKLEFSEPSYEHKLKENTEDDGETREGKADLWTPLNCLVEAANRTKSSKSNFQGISLPKSDPTLETKPFSHEINSRTGSCGGNDNDNAKNKDHAQDVKIQGYKNGTSSIPASLKHRRFKAARKTTAMYEETGASIQAMLDASGAENHRRDCPIWFSLVACESQKGVAPLPQIPRCYLRIKDAKMPVSFIQKYLVKKLNLASESEVEIMCWGEPLVPTLKLHNLVDLWAKTVSSAKVAATVGSTAKDFVMVLSYCRKV